MSEKKTSAKKAETKKVKKDRGKFLRDARGEFKKISWPSKKQVWNNVVVVLITVAIFAVITGGLDYLLALLRNFVIGFFDKAA